MAPGYSSEKLFCYLCEDLEVSSLPCDDDENLKVIILDFDEIRDKINKGEIKDAKTVACCLAVINRYK